MKNNGLFSSLFIAELKDSVQLDDAARGRMATLTQTWQRRNAQDSASLWESFLKQALGYLEFVPPGPPGRARCLSALRGLGVQPVPQRPLPGSARSGH